MSVAGLIRSTAKCVVIVKNKLMHNGAKLDYVTFLCHSYPNAEVQYYGNSYWKILRTVVQKKTRELLGSDLLPSVQSRAMEVMTGESSIRALS